MIWGRGLRLYFMRSWQDFKPLDSILWLLLVFFRSYTQLFWQWHWLGTKLCGFGRNSICPFVHLSLLSPPPGGPSWAQGGPSQARAGPIQALGGPSQALGGQVLEGLSQAQGGLSQA